MALLVRRQRLPNIARRCKTNFGWGGALAVGLAALSARSILGHVACGDIRTRYCPHDHGRPIYSAIRSFTTSLPQRLFSFSPLSSNTSTMTLKPPQAALKWNHTAEEILRLTKQAIEEYRKVLDDVGSLDPKDCTFESVCFIIVPHRLC